jgi:hypothetical protein
VVQERVEGVDPVWYAEASLHSTWWWYSIRSARNSLRTSQPGLTPWDASPIYKPSSRSGAAMTRRFSSPPSRCHIRACPHMHSATIYHWEVGLEARPQYVGPCYPACDSTALPRRAALLHHHLQRALTAAGANYGGYLKPIRSSSRFLDSCSSTATLSSVSSDRHLPSLGMYCSTTLAEYCNH